MSSSILPVASDKFIELSQAILTVPEHNMLVAYMERGGHQLSADTASKFFELYLNGSDCREIHRLNKAFPYESILWARVKFEWDKRKDDHTISLIEQVKQKAAKAALDTTGLLSDMLVAASKKHGDKIKRYLQTGNEDDLGDAMGIDSIMSLLKAVEGLNKITGADRVHKIDEKKTLDVNVRMSNNLSPETSAAILAAIASEKREKIRGSDD